MRIVFAGTPSFAAAALAALIEAAPGRGWTIPLVLSQPDRPSGRGMKRGASAVKQLAQAHGIPVDTPASLRHGDEAAAAKRRLRDAAPDVLVVAAYGLILPQDVLDIPAGLRPGWSPRLAAVNIHASLLPRWRGAAPIARAIEAGDESTGITIMQMDAGLDTGPMLLVEAVPLSPEVTAGALTESLAALGARLIVHALERVNELVATPQPEGATYAPKIGKAEAWLDWTQPSAVLARRVRAFDPFPVASTVLRGAPIKLWRAVPVPARGDAPPGTVTGADAEGVTIACGDGALRVTELQRPGARRLNAREFLAGFPLRVGARCESAPAA
ncbi:MAG TPA: methionyl-tRNA formyltransferase [Burkholderiaceae bacterium]|nr:methionyl-tRNA formyltransferase [Burkholderiaceae bacterium]